MKAIRKTIYLITMLICCAATGAPVPSTVTNSGVVSVQKDEPPVGSTAYYDLKIRECFKKNDWTGAKSLLDAAIKKYPHMSAFHELMGRYYLHQAEKAPRGKKSTDALYDKARYHLIRAISIDEKNVQARYYMLQLETDTRHFSSAIVYCNDLLEENPYNEDLWRKKIDLYRRLGNNAEADRLLERISTIYPADEQLHKDLVYSKTVKARQQRNSGDIQGQELTLRQLVEMDPKNAEHHNALANILYNSGRVEEAAEVAGRGAAETHHHDLVAKRAGMLCEMGRQHEAVEYVKSFMATDKSGALTTLLRDLEMQAARASQYNDSYTSYAKIYDSQHTQEALDYLVNTSIQRWYLDDAAMYVEEALKQDPGSQKLLYSQYLVQKRLGNIRKANALLEALYKQFPDNEDIAEEMMLRYMDSAKELMDQQQYAEATPLLETIYFSKAYPYVREAAFQRLYTCYFQTRQYEKAERILSKTSGTTHITQMALLYNASGKQKRALDFLADALMDSEPTDTLAQNLIKYTYEEIALPYIKELLAQGQVNEAYGLLNQAITICPDNSDLLRYGITAAQRKGDTAAMEQYVTKGCQQYPYDPYFLLKNAQMQHLAGNHRATLDEIAPMLKEYMGDSLLVNLYVESSIDIAEDFLHNKQPDEALIVIEAAQNIAPDNMELYYYKGRAYEQQKNWKEAYRCYALYKPGYAEWAEYRHHLEEISRHTLKNSLSLEYQQARPGNEDVISGNAYVNYSHIWNERSTLNLGMAYAGRDGASDQSDTEMTRGGTGVQFSGGWEYDITRHFTVKTEAAWASRYFPILMARLSASFELPKDWQLALFASYRRLRSYAGVYGWQTLIVGYDNITKEPIYGELEYVRKGWRESKRNMLQAGIGLTKTTRLFSIGGEVSGLYFDRKYFYNSNLKMKFYPKEGNTSHILALAGVGTAPESSLIDRSLPVGFNKVNTFVGAGGSYFINRHLTLGLTGTWYTMLSQSERLSTTYIANDPYIREDYRNYFYVHANLLISF